VSHATAMRRVTLRRVRDDRDLQFVVDWLSEGSRAAALTSDLRENATVEVVRAALDAGLDLRLIQLADSEPAGLVTWRVRGNPRAYELAILIGDPEMWSTGIGAEAAICAVDYLFLTLDAERVGVLTGAFNPYTSPSLQRGGFTYEGSLRHFYYVDGEYYDGLYWSMLRHEHRELIRKSAGTSLAYKPLIAPEDRERAARFVTALRAGGGAVDRG
jgi:RimJ/RimL family protein N-acetyltransferase